MDNNDIRVKVRLLFLVDSLNNIINSNNTKNKFLFFNSLTKISKYNTVILKINLDNVDIKIKSIISIANNIKNNNILQSFYNLKKVKNNSKKELYNKLEDLLKENLFIKNKLKKSNTIIKKYLIDINNIVNNTISITNDYSNLKIRSPFLNNNLYIK